MNLYHYYDKKTGPFCSISELDEQNAEAVKKKQGRKARESMCTQAGELREGQKILRRYSEKRIHKKGWHGMITECIR